MTFPSSTNDSPTTCSNNAQHESRRRPTFNLLEAHQEQVHDLLPNANNIRPPQGPHFQFAPDNQQATTVKNQLKKIQSIIDAALALLEEDAW
jgi:hypothetical protein